MEGAVRDYSGHTQGTIILEVINPLSLDTHGHLIEGRYLSASDSHYRWWATQGPGKGTSKKCLYHFCEGSSSSCGVSKGKSFIIHIERFRVLTPDDIRAKNPGWAFSRSCKGELEPTFKAMLDAETKHPGGVGSLPWLPSQEPDRQSSSSSSSSSEVENLTSKIKKLQSELKEAEKRAAKQEGKKDKKRGRSKEKAKDKKKKKRTVTSSSGERKTKKKKAGKVKDAEKKKRKASEDSGKAKKGKKRKQNRKSSSSPPPKRKLFGGEGDASGSSGDEEDETKDRGPFGGSRVEKFRGRKADHDTDDDSQSFREAPTQQASQLRLVEYSQRHPGRLASRMLLKMARETAIGSVGAVNQQSQKTPAVALHYLRTVMTPALGTRLTVRTARELHTLSVIIDFLAQKKPEEAVDVASQRMKALERSCMEGGWMSAQFLELISPEQPSLLDRAEESYLNKELALEHKVNQALKKDQKPGGPKGAKAPKEETRRDKIRRGKTSPRTGPRTP